MPFNNDNDYDTTVLSADYSDYQDTVVDQVIAFDPSLFQGKQGEMAQQAQRPTWVSAGSSPAVQAPPNHNASEDTWVLGTQQPATSRMPAQNAAQPAPQPQTQYQPQPQQQYQPQPQPQYQPQPQAYYPPVTATTGRASSTWQSVPKTTSTMMAAADSKPRKTSPVLIGAIVALAIVLVVALVVVLVVALVPLKSQQPETNTPVTVVAPSEPSDSASETAPETELESEKAPTAEHNGPGSPIGVTDGNGRALSEKEFYQLLTDYYELAGDYDASVRDAATQFNENFLKEDMSVRKAKASSLKTLKSKIRSSRDELNDIEPPFMSKNTQAYKDICELYECLYRRADVMDQAWTIDLQYDKPKEHEEEIVAPLRAQQVNGNDKYYTRFKELYPNVNIVKP